MTTPVQKRIDIEKQIVRKIVETAIAKGYNITVFDGEARAISHSDNVNAIMKEVMACDEEWLFIYTGQFSDTRIGSITLIYGNSGWDVVSDYSWKEGANTTYHLMYNLIDDGPVKELVNKLEKEWA